MDLERSSRSSQNNQGKGGKKWLLVLILLLLLANTVGLGLLVYQSLTTPEVGQENDRLTKIEKQLEKIVSENQQPEVSQAVTTETSLTATPTQTETETTTSQSNQGQGTVSTVQSNEVTPQEVKTHTVVDGDSLSVLATQYNVSYEDLVELNNLTNNIIVIGQELIISQ